MTVEQLIPYLLGPEDELHSWHKEDIVNLLRAGQKMRTALGPLVTYLTLSRQTERLDLGESIQAWDEAGGGE